MAREARLELGESRGTAADEGRLSAQQWFRVRQFQRQRFLLATTSPQEGGIMPHHYDGLPAAKSVEQSIVLAQLLILRGLERRVQINPVPPTPERAGDLRPAA